MWRSGIRDDEAALSRGRRRSPVDLEMVEQADEIAGQMLHVVGPTGSGRSVVP
jgi:ABC-type cobalamin transport system ATPase subunit